MMKTAKLGSGVNAIDIGKIGHGFMLMTSKPNPISDEEAFESIKTSLDSVPPGSKMLLNSGEFYGMDPPEANLELVARFFEKYPSYTEKAFLSVKGGLAFNTRSPDASPEYLKRSVDNILEKLRGTKKLDFFECARVDPGVPIEDQIKTLSGFVAEGKFDFIGMSECKASTLKRANASIQAHPIAAVEIEVSPWSYDDQVKEVIATSKELGTVVCAYSPLGRGFLAGKFKTTDELEEGDRRRHLHRLQDENIKHNTAIVEGLKTIAEQGYNAGTAVYHLGFFTGSTRRSHPWLFRNKKRTVENTAAGDIVLSATEMEAVEKVEENPVKGNRYFDGSDEKNLLWG